MEVVHWRYASTRKYATIRKVYFSVCPCGSFYLPCSVAVGVYFGLRPVLGNGEIGWVCILAAFPFALGGFFQYNGMNLEQFLLAFFRSEFLTPKRLVFKSENMYAKLMAHSSVKEALNLD